MFRLRFSHSFSCQQLACLGAYLEGVSDQSGFLVDNSAFFGGCLALPDLLDHFAQL